MRRTATLALLTATLMVGSSAALAQTGPPSDVPSPPAQAQAQGSADTGETNSAQRRATAGDNAQAQGSAETGQDKSTDGRTTASGQAGFAVPGDDEARGDDGGGREFGQERAEDAQARGSDEIDNNTGDTDDGNTGHSEGPVDIQDLDEVTDPDAPEVELPDEADEARGVLATITATFESVLNTLQGLFAMVTGTV